MENIFLRTLLRELEELHSATELPSHQYKIFQQMKAISKALETKPTEREEVFNALKLLTEKIISLESKMENVENFIIDDGRAKMQIG